MNQALQSELVNESIFNRKIPLMLVVNGETYKQKGECTTAKYVTCCCLPNTLTSSLLHG